MTALNSILAADIMQKDVVTLRPSTPIEEAVRTFAELHISGAPVVDAYGKIVGILSAFDVAKPENLRVGRGDDSAQDRDEDAVEVDAEDGAEGGDFSEDFFLSMEDYGERDRDRPTVADWMTADVKCVGPDWTLPRVCRLMVDEHIHRVPVVHDHRIQGILSSFDVVRCIADAHAPSRPRANG